MFPNPYSALGIIAPIFSGIIVSNRTHAAPVCSDSEIAPTGFGAPVRLETAPTYQMLKKHAISGSVQYIDIAIKIFDLSHGRLSRFGEGSL